MSNELIAAAILVINAKESESSSLQDLVSATRAVALQLTGEGSSPAPVKTEQEQLIGIKLRGFKKIEIPHRFVKQPKALHTMVRELLRAFIYIDDKRAGRAHPSAWEGHSMLLDYLFTNEGVSYILETVEKE